MPTLRERKKQHTRDALVRAALTLFTTQGFERTTVDEIVDAVEVSQRTFFRYFASKEAVALFVPGIAEDHFVRCLLERPAPEHPFEAMSEALKESLAALDEAIESVVPMELHMRGYRLIEETPALLAAHLRRSAELEERVAEIIAGREGTDLATDPRPRLVVALFSGVVRVAERDWAGEAGMDLAAMRERTARYLDQVGPELIGGWRKG
ncbi:TetR family transcriptional regulator [Streptomyces acidiscabies]|uniref:TetR family transcriptional regulator n=1 Tax=Streptomyces acidiscabies TaxID=42234 RepID=A0AAP6B6P5_9ACTN|nr:TetR family transcriptional regulator [Streptomyces acidiscabies]MBP5939846.1 TetR family transcriptional regulator [Streptomyces sp. LBUM 1476]MBZ3911031.1 TetR family transcriptional regulator [Streptomyces acidiscabies]MDX2959188.1 TetR family transcriptional regulator [Streptomyces acidiscabies]MDX3017668.1 TetR family transcriptional regulator [Streptomyces acidiscabies]MDX3788143.1 TetR family transcriptional regulator [Streptomyces acidiscabies]